MINLYEYIKMAVHNITANKGRSFLTMLGIIIGIASVIAIVSIGEGTKNQMNSEIDDIGGGQIAVSVSNDAITESEFITAEDVQAVREIDTIAIRELDGIEGVNVTDSFDGETTTGKGNFTLMVTGEGPDAKLLNNAVMKHGVYFGENEVQEGKNVCVLSDSDAKRLFGTDDVVGMTVDVNCYGLTKSLRICGVTTQKENGTFVSYTYEGMPVTINVPYTTMNEFTGVSDYFFSVTMQADKSLNSQDVADKVVKLMEKRHQCAGKDYFQVQSFQDIMSSMNQMLDMVKSKIVSLYADVQNVINENVDDYFKIIMKFENGVTAEIELGTYYLTPKRAWFIGGNKGSALIDGFAGEGKIVRTAHLLENVPGKITMTAAGPTRSFGPPEPGLLSEEPLPEVNVDHRNYFEHFLKAFNGEEDIIIKPEQVRRVLCVMDAVRESAKTGKAIAFEE